MHLNTDDVIRQLARSQLGVFTREQACSEKVTSRELRYRVESGALERVSDTVFRLAGAPLSHRSTVMASVLDAGPSACASHWTAAALWGLPGGSLLPVHAIAARSTIRTHSYLARVHQPRSLIEPHLARHHDIPVTTPARTLFDLAGLPSIHPKRIERLLDTVLARKLATIDRLKITLDALAVRGRRGIVLMRQLIEQRVGDFRPTESGLEFRFQELARQAGLRDLARQVDLGDDDDWIGRVDFVDRNRRIVVETDTVLHHGSVTDWHHDEVRRSALVAAGWTVLSITDIDIFHRSDQTITRLRRLRHSPLVLAS